jgi:hypothetical protein
MLSSELNTSLEANMCKRQVELTDLTSVSYLKGEEEPKKEKTCSLCKTNVKSAVNIVTEQN